jgi:DNA-binding SARP family transcriptional activator/predicted ATPase
MPELMLKFLGDLEVLRNGRRAELPPSRKTRALLAYLALQRRPFRREHLCELLWDVPDDPRGSLRWSLSKLRQIVDGDTRPRILADRQSVRFDLADTAIDTIELAELAGGDVDAVDLPALEAAATRYAGHFLEGLSLPNFHDFEAWCTSERENVMRAQMRLLRTLVERLADAPERAVEHARAWVRLAAYDETARSALIRLLVALGRPEQAEQHYRAGVRLLAEIGATSTGELYSAWRGAPGRTRPISRGAEPAPAGAIRDASASSPVQADAQTHKVQQPPGSSSLVGRSAELGTVAEILQQVVTQARARVVLVCGEPGIGKSRLLEAIAAKARETGALVLSARAYESETMRPFGLWIDALESLGAQATQIFELGTDGNRARLLDGLAETVAHRTQQQPVVLLLDDVQWGDESSAAALHYVTRSTLAAPLLVVLAGRDDELRDNTRFRLCIRELRAAGLLDEIPLGPLDELALRTLIGTRAPQADGERLSRQCGGNPLLAIELARAEAAGDSGRSLGEVVRERLARFDFEGGEVLRWAAVLAPRIDAATLARATGLDWNQIGEALEAAARQSMLVPAERGLRFSHDLIAESIYSDISPARRRTMHRRIAELLEQDAALDPVFAADLAHHAAQSGDAPLAARALICAGRLCLRFFANDEASLLVRKAAHWIEQLPAAERVCLTLEAREVTLAATPIGDWEAAAAEATELAERALDHGALSHARRGYYMASYLRWMHGHWTGARDGILQAERVARGGSDEDHIAGMAEAARCLAMIEHDLTDADAMLMEAQALAARKGVTHQAIPAARGMLRYHQNRLDEAAELFKEARLLAKSDGDRLSEFQANEYLAMIELQRGDVAAAKSYCATLIELGTKLRDGSERPFAQAFDALCHYALADDAAPLETALTELRAADAKHRLAYTLTRAALIDLERQRPAAALARGREALGYAEALDRPSEMLLAHVALAQARGASNDPEGYEHHKAALIRLAMAPVAGWALERAIPLLART